MSLNEIYSLLLSVDPKVLAACVACLGLPAFLLWRKQQKPSIEKFFKGKRIIITGASMGIGECFARALAKYDTKLVLAARSTEELNKVAKKCEQSSTWTEVITQRCDVTKPEDCAALIDKAVTVYGGIDTLFLNAGISQNNYFEEIEDFSIFQKLMDVNYFGNVQLLRHALPHLKKSKGSIGVTGSGCGLFGVPNRTGYVASKHAITGFCKSLRTELGGNDVVGVTVFHVPFVKTDIWKHSPPASSQSKVVRPDSSKQMSVEQCVSICLRALAENKTDEYFDSKTKFGQILYIFKPDAVERILRKVSHK
eukprot:gb/GECH01004230.1/.p1 GENE.gb/GECH01004230.1/~~gb/GECH01004230.1/.p1  ORF type:complete len:309 (+),score=65.54 gb/GECH01004230.1/:1-927(+)